MLLNAHAVTDRVIYVAIDIRPLDLFSEAYLKRLNVCKVPMADNSNIMGTPVRILVFFNVDSG